MFQSHFLSHIFSFVGFLLHSLSLMASMSFVLLLLQVFLVLAAEVVALENNSDGGGTGTGGEIVMEEEELLGLFEVLGSLLEDPDWSQVHPLPCTDTPWPGVQCEIGDEDPPIFHVTKIHIGPDVLDPPCKSSATLSKSLLKLKYLRTLSLFNCFLTSPLSLSPTLFGTFSSLEHLALVSNPALIGVIPPSLAEVTSLRVLSLSQNNLHGKIPDELGGLVNLEQLDLSYNNLSGEIPGEIGGLKHLSILDLSWNGLEGMVPYSLGHLQYLQKIDLGSNRLVSKVPRELGKLKRLVLLDFSHNFLIGPLPETLSCMEQLEYLLIEGCPINTGIPLFLGALRKLTTLSLSGCGFTGPIPTFFPSLKNLTSLSLDNNALRGTVPPNIGTLPHLDQLNLSQNQLSGEVLFQQEFINRLGKRLDLRGNHGLCTSNKQERSSSSNNSMYLGIPSCLDTSSSSCNNKTWADEEPDGIERVRPPNWYHEKMSSKSPRLHQIFIPPNFVAVWLLISFLMQHY